MEKLGRNAPCHCGSGKKYKKCCLAKDEAANPAPPPAPTGTWVFDDDDEWNKLDELSNSVIDLIGEKRFDEALAVSARLLKEYPEVVDGLHRFGMIYAAMGNHALAAEYYRKAFAYVSDPVRNTEYENHEYFLEKAIEQEKLTEQP
jgi:tetratricopeptide (TPR) repeat protein